MHVVRGSTRPAARPTPRLPHVACAPASALRAQPPASSSYTENTDDDSERVDISLSVQSMSQKVLLRTIPRQALAMSAAKLTSRANSRRPPSAIPPLHDAAAALSTGFSTQASTKARRQALAELQRCTDVHQLHAKQAQLVSLLDGSGLSAAAARLVQLLHNMRKEPAYQQQAATLPAEEQAVTGLGVTDASSSSGSSASSSSGSSASSSGADAGSSGAEREGEGQDDGLLEARRRANDHASTSGSAGRAEHETGSSSWWQGREAGRLAAVSIADQAYSRRSMLTMQQASTIIYCLAQAGHYGHVLVPRLLEDNQLWPHLGGLSASEHYRLIWGLAILDAEPPEGWLQEWSKASQSRFHLAQPVHLATYAWALGRLRHTPSDLWLHSLMEATEPLLPTLEPQSLCNLVWGLGRLGAKPTQEWGDQCMAATLQLLQSSRHVKAGGISTLLYGMVLMGMQPGPSFLEACLQGVQGRLLRHTPLDDCNLMWALAAWSHTPTPAFMQAFADYSQRRLHTYSAKDLALTAWSLASLSYLPPAPWLSRYFTRSLEAIHHYGPADIVGTLMAAHRWGIALEPLYTSQLLTRTKEIMKRLSLRNHVSLLWALVQLQVPVSPTWLAVQMRYVRPYLRQADAAAVALLLYCGAVLAPGDKEQRRQFVQDAQRDVWRLVQRSHELLKHASPQDLYAYIIALARLKINPGIKYLKAHVTAVRAHGAAFTREEVEAMRTVYQRLGRQPPLRPQVDRIK